MKSYSVEYDESTGLLSISDLHSRLPAPRSSWAAILRFLDLLYPYPSKFPSRCVIDVYEEVAS